MTQRLVVLIFMVTAIAGFLQAQTTKDPVLFSVNNAPVHVSEFKYIYSKTNGQNADYSKKSLDEYLDLYVKFKLKVQKARQMRLDTIPQLMDELAGYRRQLADAYLIDRTVTDKLTTEAYDRIQQDVDISHILVTVQPDATPADTLAAFEKIMDARRRIQGGEAFTGVAQKVSDDRSAVTNGGRIGFVTAVFPRGLYSLETAAYSAPLEQLTGPIRSEAGYHLVIVHARRPAIGQIEAAHILLRLDTSNPNSTKERIDSLHKLLVAGADFEGIATKFSQDRQTAQRGGYIGFFGVQQLEDPFEEAAFALKTDGAFSAPFRTSLGWHIVKRISLKGIQPYSVEKSRLETKISQDPRFAHAKSGMLARIKKENDFKENRGVLDNFVNSLTDTFLTFKWKAPEIKSPEVLFSLGKDFKVSLGEFTDYLNRASRDRLRMGRGGDVSAAAHSLYESFINEQVLKFEEGRLEERYPEFKSLMREYEEGILLFEATKMLVWDKASQDSAGLEKFYETIRGKYRWNQRAVTHVFRISDQYKDRIEEIRKFAETHSIPETQGKFNTPEAIIVNVEEETLEKGRNADLDQMEWKKGNVSKAILSARSKIFVFYKIEDVLPSTEKTLQEARGYILADYQDHLEKQWVEGLQKEFSVRIDQTVLESLVMKK